MAAIFFIGTVHRILDFILTKMHLLKLMTSYQYAVKISSIKPTYAF